MMEEVLKHMKKGTLYSAILHKVGLEQDHRKVQACLEQIFTEPENEALKLAEPALKGLFQRPLLRNHDLPSGYLKALTSLLVAKRINNDLPTDLYDQVLYWTADLEAERLPTDKWIKLTYIATCNGMFRLSGIFRKKAVDSTKVIPITNKYKAFLAFKAAVDQGDFTDAEKYLEKLGRYLSNDEFNKYMLYYLLPESVIETQNTGFTPCLAAN